MMNSLDSNNNIQSLQKSCNCGYDTVAYSLRISTCEYQGLVRVFKCKLSKLKSSLNQYEGKYRNLYLSLHPDQLFINGSLPKFLYYDSRRLISFNDHAEILLELESILEIDLSLAKVYSLHFAIDLDMSFPIDRYLRLFGPSKRYIKSNFSKHSIYYSLESNIRTINIYDKLREMKNKGDIRYLENHLGHLLRFELRYLKRIMSQLKATESITAGMLNDPQFYDLILNNAVDEYFKIQKLAENDLIRMPENPINFSGGMNTIFSHLIADHGLERTLSIVENLDSDGHIKNPQVKSRIKSRIKKLYNESIVRKSELIEELDKKFEQMRFFLEKFVCGTIRNDTFWTQRTDFYFAKY